MAASNLTARKANRFASLSPLAKLAIWVASIAILASIVQAVAWVFGTDFNILRQSGGRGVLLGLALGTLLAMMAIDGRPAADYGLAVGSSWQKLFLGGLGLGMLAYFGYFAAILLPLTHTLQADSVSLYRCFSAGLSATTAVPVALTQQIIFSGYLLSILRERYSRATAVLVPAVLFALLRRLDDPAALLSAESYPLVVGMFLIAALLGIIRLQTGSIVYPAGFLSGCIFVRRFLRKTALLAPAGQAEAASWTAPNNDPMQSPLMWAFLSIAIVACWLMLRRQKTDKVLTPTEKVLDTGFKRVFPFSNAFMLAPLDLWIGRLIDARFRVGLKYIPRLMAILVFSTFNTILSLPERLVAPLLVRWRRVPDPVFIVGVHRSGTTHLHNLLALDPQFCTPRSYQTLNSAGFFFFSWLIAPLLGAFLPWKRPMDSVRFTIFSPQEDEFAIAGTSRFSPHWAMTFPRRAAAYDRYIFVDRLPARQLKAWKRHLMTLLGKLTFWSSKRPLLKNPYNTARAGVLNEMFPKARFIHISRDPVDVYRSNMHLAREGHVVNQLQDPDQSDSYQTRFLDNYREMEDTYYRETAGLSSDQVTEIRFDQLERDPIAQVRRIYDELGLEFTDLFQQRLETYMAGIADYKKNRFNTLPEFEQRQITAKLGHLMHRWGYLDDTPAAKAA